MSTKSDIRRVLLLKAERRALARAQEVKKLLAEHENLKNKEVVLEQIIEGLSTMSQLMALSSGLNGGKDTLLDEALTSLLDLEISIHQHTCQANAFTANGTTSQDSSSSSACSPYCLVFLQKVFDPEYAKEVVAMSEEEVVARLSYLAGKCAIMVVQNQEQAAVWRSRSALHNSCSNSSFEQQSAATSGQMHQQPGGSSSADATNAANSAQAAACPAGAADGNAAAADNWRSTSDSITSSPEFEYACLAGTLMQWDIARYTRIVANNFETGQPLQPMPPSHWLHIGQRLHLSKAQLATFRGLKDLLETAMGKMFDNLDQTTKQQQEMIQQQEVQLQMEQLMINDSITTTTTTSTSSNSTSLLADASDLHEAQAEAVSVQSSVLKRWHILWMHMGIVMLNTLTPRQMATLIAAAYPAVMRIDSAVLDHLDALEQHCEQQQLPRPGSLSTGQLPKPPVQKQRRHK